MATYFCTFTLELSFLITCDVNNSYIFYANKWIQKNRKREKKIIRLAFL